MAKDIKLGIRYRNREARLWQRNGFEKFVPATGFGTTYRLWLWILMVYLHVDTASNGNTKLFNFTIEIQI